MTSADLRGKTAIVTGASRGIGLAAAQALAAAGAIGVAAHAVDEDHARRCVELAVEKFGSVDILVNNAGTNPALAR